MAENDVIKNKQHLLKTQMAGLTKSKQVLDGLGRLEFLYSAPINAKNPFIKLISNEYSVLIK